LVDVEPGLFTVHGLTAEQVGEAAAAAGLTLHELTPVSGSLEEAFFSLTRDDVEFHAGSATHTTSEEAS
jgi:ABC-2 type transport system ATP-binding protein